LKFVDIGTALLVPVLPLILVAQTPTSVAMQKPTVVQPVLIEPGSRSFHLKAVITEKSDPDFKADAELFWVGPNKFRRTIKSEDFSQTLIVNGDKVFEENSDDYFPVDLQILMTALVDPRPVLDAFRPGDVLLTEANGAALESGQVCYQGNGSFCIQSRTGLLETVGSLGREITFTSYKDFKGKRVARMLFHRMGPGNSLQATVTDLSELKDAPESLFRITQITPEQKRNHPVLVSDSDFRSLAISTPEIIWPQTLDGAEKGTAIFHISIDPSGKVRDVIPVRTDNERADESACRQIKNWKFKPLIDHEIPVQAESFLTLAMDTRAYGPPAPLSDKEARALASNIIDPIIPPGTAPSGSSYTLRAAIDVEGRLIEVIGGGGPPKLNKPCYAALKQWHFSPIMENGQPRPYRAEITFRVP
jgi:hypothetical protein